MARRATRPDRVEAFRLLEELWQIALNEEDQHAPAAIADLVNAAEVGMRFCLPTQLLGKLTDNSLDALILQLRAGPPGNWNARTFAEKVITGGAGIKAFIVHVGRQLDAFNTQPKHRKAWKALLVTL